MNHKKESKMTVKEETKEEILDVNQEEIQQDSIQDTEEESSIEDVSIEEPVENPVIDAVHNGNWTDLKAKIEKQVADKIQDRIQLAKTEYLSKTRGI